MCKARSFETGCQYRRADAGAVAIVVAMVMPVILGMAGLSVDASSWFMAKRNLQTAADAAAMAAAYEYANGDPTSVEDAARREAAENGFNAATDVLTLTMTEGEDDAVYFSVDLTHPADMWFSSVFLDTVEVSVEAESRVQPGEDGSACVLSLDETANKALKTSGNVGVDMPDCGIAVNSDADDAMYFNGSVDVDVADVRVHGEYEEVGGAVDFTYDSLKTQAARVSDPYEDLDVPAYTSCSKTAKKSGASYTTNKTLTPGVYCGGLSLSGNSTVTLQPGVYIMDGGDFTVTGGGTLVGSGVTIILTNSPTGGGSYGNLNISGGRQISLTAPTDGSATEGVVFYQDRNATQGNGANYSNSITGTADISIDGTMYFPARELTVGGNSSSASANPHPCSRVIARTITLHGNPRLSNSCDDSAARSIPLPGAGSVKLVN